MKENKLRELIRQGAPSTCTRMWSIWPFYTELVGSTGHFDYIEFVAEYAPFTEYDLENIARAAELNNMGTMIKVDYQNRGYIAQKAVAAGFQAVLFADHHTPDEVRETVEMMKSDKLGQGRYGYPNRRFIGCQPYLSQMDHCQRVDDVVLAFMIEKGDAMDNIEEICQIPGVDMVQFGPSDYSMSKGKNSADYRDEFKAAEKRMIEVALKNGVRPRCELLNLDGAQYYIDMGVKDFSLVDECFALRNFWNTQGKRIREIADSTR